MAKRKDKAARPKMRQPKKGEFLAAFAICGTVTRAAEVAGIDRHTHARWMRDDREYADAFAVATDEAADRLEEEARRRAHEGVGRLKFHQGQPIMVAATGPEGRPVFDEFGNPKMVPYVEHEHSDTLLIFLLKGARPQKFRDNSTVEHKGEIKFGRITMDGGKEATDG